MKLFCPPKILTLLSFLIMGLSSPSLALPLLCDGADIYRIERPYDAENPSSETFTLRFQITPGTEIISTPQVIFLPGGPGGTSITDKNKQAVFTTIYTDPRGTGCNIEIDPRKFPADFFSTENLAADILAIIQTQRLSDYILRGQSYGTMLATVVAGKAENGAAPRPRGLMLEGTLGHHFKNENIYAGFQNEWKKAKANLPPLFKNLFEQPPLSAQLTEDEWGRAMAVFLMIGPKLEAGIPWDLHDLLPATASTDPKLNAQIVTIVKSLNLAPAPLERTLYRHILCRELATTDNVDLALVEGALVGHRDPQLCEGITPLNQAYDAKDHPTSAPIYYFQGAHDPATTLDQAQYHFNNQKKSNRHFTLFPKAAHFLNGALSTCYNEVLKSISLNGKDLKKAISLCQGHPQIKIKTAN